MTEPELEALLERFNEVQVEQSSIRLAVRRSIRIPTPAGDEFRTVESEQTWTIRHPDGAMSLDLAQVVALKLSPLMLKKIYLDLVIAGVCSQEHAASQIKFAKESYEKALIRREPNVGPVNKQGEDRSSVPGTSNTERSAGAESSTGSEISSGKDSGVSPETGQSERHVLGGETPSPIDPNIR